MRHTNVLFIFLVLSVCTLVAQSDVLGIHNMSPGGPGTIKGSRDVCLFCHAPHSGIGKGPLWSQKLATGTSYTLAGPTTSTTLINTEVAPTQGVHSNLCLSCHDGTVAPGEGTPYGSLRMSPLTGIDSLTTSMLGSHPFSLKLPLQDSPSLVSTLVAGGITADSTKKIKLINGNVECTSCHNPHVQSTDSVSKNFLLLDSSSGQMCMACHSSTARTVTGKTNPLTNWTTSIHNTAGNQNANALLGSYPTIAKNACLSCHMPHEAASTARILRGYSSSSTADAATQNCMNCHDGSNIIAPALKSIVAEYAKQSHKLPTPTNFHDAAEATLLNNNRHATCVDCHNPHSSLPVTTFPAAPLLRASQNGINGISATDGTTVLTPALNQYENCLRCHAGNTNKPTSGYLGYMPSYLIQNSADPYNVFTQMGASAISVHPVMRPRSGNAEPSLLPSMLDLSGNTTSRDLSSPSVQIFCIDCHNSEDDREFGGTGPNGPHGSQYNHILERRYEQSTVGTNGPGGAIVNLFPSPSISANCSSYPCVSPYGLCTKCHSLTSVLSNATGSFQYHYQHVSQLGVSCSACHSVHGVPFAGSTTGQRLVNFDINVVAPNGSNPITYNPTTQTCTLLCHNYAH